MNESPWLDVLKTVAKHPELTINPEDRLTAIKESDLIIRITEQVSHLFEEYATVDNYDNFLQKLLVAITDLELAIGKNPSLYSEDVFNDFFASASLLLETYGEKFNDGQFADVTHALRHAGENLLTEKETYDTDTTELVDPHRMMQGTQVETTAQEFKKRMEQLYETISGAFILNEEEKNAKSERILVEDITRITEEIREGWQELSEKPDTPDYSSEIHARSYPYYTEIKIFLQQKIEEYYRDGTLSDEAYNQLREIYESIEKVSGNDTHRIEGNDIE